MIAHWRANLILISLTLALCSVFYPLTVLLVAKGLFPAKASGSLVLGPDGEIVGSRLIAQEHKGDEWFQSRPSSASYKASASGGSNWSANNPKLRDRAAQQLGPVVRYRPALQPNTVQQDIEAWFAVRPDRCAQWAKAYPALASAWVTDSANEKAVQAWTATNPGDFFETFVAMHPGSYPVVEKDIIQPATSGSAIQSAFFEMWLQDNPTKANDIEPVPADAVTASGSGLDPHITVRNANSQMDRVVSAWAAKTKTGPNQVRGIVEAVLRESAFAPLAGLAGGEPLVNTLEVNLALAQRFGVR